MTIRYRRHPGDRLRTRVIESGEYLALNIGGDGEIAGAINVNGHWLDDADWKSGRLGNPTLLELEEQGHEFILCRMDDLPFDDDSVDVIYTNNVCIDIDSYKGPCPKSADIRRILKPSGRWFRDGVMQP